MPKKTRKMKQRASMRRSVEPTTIQETELAEEATTTSVAAITPSVRPLSTAPRVVSTATYDYSYIYGDLKRIALFASFFFAVLVILAVFVIK